ncbi:unnamed protein product [Pseudo-nitzschia multistriata]|uniref:Uncharacterized protein n=1 Tax=Pseudo-nitzschia multistriata TaxID=183589 RepID=A0A448YYK1_9STRA|nr:unnamed protein product [Pseudo-nitzschia multistriata]
MTYCSSLSPVSRSIPFLSSPGMPWASWSAAPPPNALPEEGVDIGLADDGPAEDKPALPNLAAILAFASSRSLVWRRTYCSSLSPVSRSIPFLSSPGMPWASCKLPPIGFGWDMLPMPPIEPVLLPKLSNMLEEDGLKLLLLVFVDPNPLYLLVFGLLACTSRWRAARPSASGWVTEVATSPTVVLREFQKLPPIEVAVLAKLLTAPLVDSSFTADAADDTKDNPDEKTPDTLLMTLSISGALKP